MLFCGRGAAERNGGRVFPVKSRSSINPLYNLRRGNMHKEKVANGIWWVDIPEAGLFVQCGCPADSVKQLFKRGLISEVERDGFTYETGPNAILLSDVALQGGE